MQAEDEIKKKLSEMFNNYEAEPQDESWEKIRASIQLSQMFQNFEAEPQDESWEKIRASVDLSQRMKEYEPEPQDDSWAKIQAGVNLAQKFKDYEAEPQAISWLKIQEAIQPKKRRRGIIIPLFYRIGIAAGLVLLLGSLWWLLNTNETTNMTATKAGSKKSASQPTVKANKANEPAPKVSEKIIDAQIETSTNENIATNTPADKNGVSDKNNTISSKENTKANNKESLLAKDNTSNKKKVESNNTPPLSNTDSNQKIADNENTLANASIDNKAEEDLELEELSGKAFQQKAIRKPFGAIAYNAEKPYQEKEPRQYRQTVFSASFMPLQTYQAFTVLPQTNAYIQQVGRLDAIDNQRLGVQLRAGAMKPLSNRFSIGVSGTYTGVQQWANYEINSGEYEVQNADNGSYTLVGVGEQVTQNQFLQTIGLKLDNAYLLSQKKTKVYAIAGAEVVHVLNNKDFGYYLNASVGLSYPVKGGKSIWIEPTFRYSLSQSFDANNYLKIRPYNIGLNLRFNFI